MMDNLRMIVFYNPYDFTKDSNVILPTCLESLPDDLKFLRWDGFPQKSFPLDFSPKNLVKLDMPHSHLTQLWQGDKVLPNLKILDLRGSQALIQIPDLAQCPNIEEVILSHCKKLGQVYSSSFLCKLKCLWLNGCISLRSLHIPSNILLTTSGLIVLHGCRDLEMFSVGNAKMGVQLHGHTVSRHRNIFTALKLREKRSRSPYEKFSNSFDLLDCLKLNTEPKHYMQLLKLEVLRKESPSLFPSLNELCWLDLSYCQFLLSLPTEIFKLKFLKRLYLRGCFNFEDFGEIKETVESLMLLVLDETAIKELPSSLHHLVGLEELSLRYCRKLDMIPSSIGSLGKLSKLDLIGCESLETFPSSIFKLKLTKLDLHCCLMLKTFPEILEPAETFVHINLTKTAIKELPSSMEYLVRLQTLCLNMCTNLVSLPNSIVNLNYLSELDCSGCHSLTEIPNNIGSFSSLRELSLQESSIVNLPESIAHLSSLKSLDLSDCKNLACMPPLPPSLNQLFGYDCPTLGRMMTNSKKDTFKFHFFNSQELDETACSNIGAESWLRITEDAYRPLFFCFPGSAVPGWFPYRCTGRPVTMKRDSQDWPSNNRLVGFALSVVLGRVDIDDTIPICSSFTYTLTYESDGRTHIVHNFNEINYYFHTKGRSRSVVQNHIFMWKYHLNLSSIGNRLLDAHNFTFGCSKLEYLSSSKSSVIVKEYGICPLYRKEKDENGGNSLRH
ncbi:hypothetical protein RYX36_033148 [Vicia faba]